MFVGAQPEGSDCGAPRRRVRRVRFAVDPQVAVLASEPAPLAPEAFSGPEWLPIVDLPLPRPSPCMAPGDPPTLRGVRSFEQLVDDEEAAPEAPARSPVRPPGPPTGRPQPRWAA